MQLRKLIYILSVVIVLLMLSCEKDIEIELSQQPDMLVMYSFMYPDSALNLHFSKSENILSTASYQQVENARFRITINGESQGTYILPSDDVWSEWKEFVFNEGDTVDIEAFEKEGDTVRVETYLPYKVPIQITDTTSIYKYEEGYGEYFLKTKLKFTDSADKEDYYQLYIVREGYGEIAEEPYYTREVIEYRKEDAIFEQRDQSGSLLQGLDFQGLFTDYLINGETYTISVDIPQDYLFLDYYESKIKVSAYLYHHTDDYYAYFRSRILSAGIEGVYEGLPIFDPVTIHNNIEGGLGLVSGMSFGVDSLVIEK